MAAQTGLFVHQLPDGSGTTSRGARLALAGLLAKNTDGTVKTGVLADGLGPVVTGTAGMSYSIRKHVAVTKASEVNGPTLVPNDGAVTVPTDPAPGTNSRIDIIYVLQRLISGDGGSETTNQPLYAVAKGVTSATPVAPPLPAGALELARTTVTVGTTATSGLTFTYGTWTTTSGGKLPLADTLVESGASALWGAAFNAVTHQRKIFSDTVVVVPNASGDVALILDLTTRFAGVSSVVATPGDVGPVTSQIKTQVSGNTLGARLFNGAGTPLAEASGNQRVNFVVCGWV